MTLGLLILLAVVGVAQIAALAARRRLLARRRKAQAAGRGWYMLRDELGLHVGTSPFIDPGTIIVGEIPPLLLEEGPLLCDHRLDLDLESRRRQLSQDLRLAAVLNYATARPFIITGI